MAIANGSRNQIAYVTELTWGTTPGTPAMIGVPYTSFNVNLTKETFEDTSVQADRMQRYNIHGNRTIGGDIDVNLSHGNFDAFLESALQNSFATNVLKVGSTRKSFTIEQGSLDIGQYTAYTGMVVDKVALSVPVSGLVTAKFSMIGKDATISGTPLDATITAPAAKQPYIHAGGTFNEGGSPIAFLTAVELNIDNGHAVNNALGSTTARDFSPGFATITGTASAYFEDVSLINKFINATDSSLSFTLTDGTNTLTFNLPKIKYTGANRPFSGQGSVVVELPFTALWESGAASNIVITRSA